MNDQLKQRLVGAIVLVSLAVIFIPMILPGGGDGGAMSGKEVPSEPDYRFPPPKSAPKAPPMSSAVNVPIGETGEKSSTSKDNASKSESSKKPSVKKSNANKTSVSSTANTSAVKSGQVTAWIVQVGSFKSASNAKALRDKLRKMGYSSFVEAIKSKNVMNYRVRVGPELTRTLADQLRKQLETKAKLKGVVQSYP